MAKYDLAISFAGEQRQLAEFFARRLDASGYSIFYDEYTQADCGAAICLRLSEISTRTRHGPASLSCLQPM